MVAGTFSGGEVTPGSGAAHVGDAPFLSGVWEGRGGVAPAWLDALELADATCAYRAQHGHRRPNALTPVEIRRRADQLLREGVAFIDNPRFQQSGAAEEIFDRRLNLQCAEAARGGAGRQADAGGELPVLLSRMCRARLLTPEQESLLFQRMNFLRSKAALECRRLQQERTAALARVGEGRGAAVGQQCAARLELIERLVALADWHRDRIVEANLRLVFSIVKKFVDPHNEFEELLSEGIMALIRAVDKFDYDRGFRFSTYATQVVRRSAYQAVLKRHEELRSVLGRQQEPDLEFSDEGRGAALSEQRWHELRRRLAGMLEELDRREKLIVRARFSLGAHRKVQTLQALADRLGVSKERVRQLETRALQKLRAMAGEVRLEELEA